MTTGGVPLTDLRTQQDNFAIAQFEDLSDQDKKDLVEFMKACTGEFPKIERGRLPE